MSKGQWFFEYTIRVDLTARGNFPERVEKNVSLPLYVKTEKGAVNQAKKEWRRKGERLNLLGSGIDWLNTAVDNAVFSNPRIVFVRSMRGIF